MPGDDHNDIYGAVDAILALRDTATCDEPSGRETFLDVQASYPDCFTLAHAVGIPSSDFLYYRNGFLIRRSRLDGALQKGVPSALSARV